MDSSVHVVRVRVPEGARDYATVLPPEEAMEHGLPNQAIAGALLGPVTEGGEVPPELFVPNPAFVRFLHDALARHAAREPGLREEARRVGDGWVYVVDARTPDPSAQVPPEDVIGAVEVRGGEPVAGSYRANPGHALLTARGFFRLGEELHAMLLREIRALRSPG